MKITLRLAAVIGFVCSASQINATPLLFLNYNPAQVAFAQSRAAALGLPYETLAEFNALADLNGKSVVIMPGTSNYVYNTAMLADFVQAGGYVWINVAGPTCKNDFAPGGVDFLQYSCGGAVNQSETVVNPAHSYVTGAFDSRASALTAADFVNWNATDLGHLSQLPANATILASNPQGPTLAQYSYGAGSVVVSTLTYGWGENGARGTPMDNMLLYAAAQVNGGSVPVTPTPEPSSLMFTLSGALFGFVAIYKKVR